MPRLSTREASRTSGRHRAAVSSPAALSAMTSLEVANANVDEHCKRWEQEIVDARRSIRPTVRGVRR
jgi:hypothetical protein